jgi:hypothetical protein
MPTPQHATVADFLDSLAPDRRAEVEALRAIVGDAHPGLVESIKWNSPNWSLDGADLLTVNVAGKGPVRLILHRGATIAEDKAAAPTFAGDPTGMLKWHSDIRASLAMPGLESLESLESLPSLRDDIVAVVRAWVSTPPAH